MGDARKKQTRLERFLVAQPWCVYCGGVDRAETIDHMPPITLFDRRDRPKGAEFPACGACNGGARRDDQIAGLLSRVLPDVDHPATAKDLALAHDGVRNNHPQLLMEMVPRPEQVARLAAARPDMPARGVHVLNARGPLLNAAMRRFAARFGLAFHFFETGKIVPPEGCVAVRWFSNFEMLAGDGVPEELLRLVGSPRTLRQGRKEVGSQFRYASTPSEDGLMSIHFASFRLSFALTAIVSLTDSNLDPAPASHILKPGFLKTAG